MKYKKEKWNYEPLEDILTPEQLGLLEKWLEVYGVRVFGDMPNNGESWEIDFIRAKKEKE